MGPQRQAALAALLVALLCGAYTAQAVDVRQSVKNFVREHIEELVVKAEADSMDGMSNYIADGLEARGEYEAAAVVREGSDVFEEGLRTAFEASACYGTTSTGASVGTTVGCLFGLGGCMVGFFLGAGAGALINPSCKRAIEGIGQTAQQLDEAVDALIATQCPGSAFPAADASDCIDACQAQVGDGECFNWYYDHRCCLCKAAACEVSEDQPATDYSSSGDSSCGAFEYDTDYWGGDIVPVGTKWPDTAVAASSPEDCCEACGLYDYCQAWTFTRASHCKERLPDAPGCCFLKKGTDYEVRSEPGMISGTRSGPSVASCTLEMDTDFFGGDIQSGDGPDTVVPTISDADCCQSCAATPGCAAWTMAPRSDCNDRLPGARGCCFLKYEGGWTRTEDPNGALASGILL